MDEWLPTALPCLGAREIGRALCTCSVSAAASQGVWQELFLARHYIAFATPNQRGRVESLLWRDLARSIFTGAGPVPRPEGAWTFRSLQELDHHSSKWRGCPAADLAGVALFKELHKQHESSYGKDPMSTAFYRGHLRALRRSRPMAAVPVTFRWSDAERERRSGRGWRSTVCVISLPQGSLELRLEQWEEFLQLSAEVKGWPSLSLLHVSAISIEPDAPFIMSLLGRKRMPSKWLRPMAWLLPGFDPLPRWWPALGGGQDGGSEGPCDLQMTSLRALVVLRFAEAKEDFLPWVGTCQSSDEDEDSSHEPSTSPSEPRDEL